ERSKSGIKSKIPASEKFVVAAVAIFCE
ncbi:unnamed protein product, partial [Oikopleura dioica]